MPKDDKKPKTRTLAVTDENGRTIASADVSDIRQLSRVMAQLDRKSGQRSRLVIAIRDHYPTQEGDDIICTCGETLSDVSQWAIHVATVLVP